MIKPIVATYRTVSNLYKFNIDLTHITLHCISNISGCLKLGEKQKPLIP